MKKGVQFRDKKAAALGPVQKEILAMLTDEFLTVNQIAIRRETTVKAVYNVINKLREKGYLGGGFTKGFNFRGPLKAISKSLVARPGMWRLHALHFTALIHYSSKRYERIRAEFGSITLDGNVIKLHEKKVEVQQTTGDGNAEVGFFGENISQATIKAQQYYTRLFFRLESDLGVVLLKPGSSYEVVNSGHYAQIGNELAKDYNKKKKKLNIYGGPDGRLRFKIDNSLNMDEFEAVDPKTSEPDATRVNEAFNQIADYEGFLPSDILKLLKAQAIHVKEIGAGLNSLIELNKPQEPMKIDKKKERPDYVG